MLPISCKPQPTGKSATKAKDAAPRPGIEAVRALSTARCGAFVTTTTHPQGACAGGKCRQTILHLLEVQRLGKLLVGPAAKNANTGTLARFFLCAWGCLWEGATPAVCVPVPMLE
jgi:hypothetical protein